MLIVALLASGATAPQAPASSASNSCSCYLYTLGANYYGQLGDARHTETAKPNPRATLVTLPGAAGPVVEAAEGGFHSLVVTATGELYAFGDNQFGQLGNTRNNSSGAPNPVPTQVTLPGAAGAVAQVAAGARYSLALTSTGQLYAFGANQWGELGNPRNDRNAPSGGIKPNPTPSLITLPGATGPVAQIAAGALHSLALTSTGQLYTFGANSSGELGSTTNANGIVHHSPQIEPNPTPTPVTLPGATGPITEIAAGALHSLALTSTGQLYAFGDNEFGQLGSTTHNHSTRPNPTPTSVTLPGATGPITEIAAGALHSLALTATGQLYAFGENQFGQLGSRTHSRTRKPNPVPTPVRLLGATGAVVQLAAGYSDSFAVTSSGQLYAFGENQFGQLGYSRHTGTGTPNPAPEQVRLPAGAAVQAVARGPWAESTLVIVRFDSARWHSPPHRLGMSLVR